MLSPPLERRKYLALLWSNSCCFIFTAAPMAWGGVGGLGGCANPPAATAECVKGIKTGQETNSYGRLVALSLWLQSNANNGFTWHTKVKCGQAFTEEEEAQNLPQTGIWSLPSDSFVVLCHREQLSSNLRIVVNPGKTWKWKKGGPHDSFHSKEIYSFPLCHCSSCFQSLNTNLRALHERYSSLGIITTAATDGSF